MVLEIRLACEGHCCQSTSYRCVEGVDIAHQYLQEHVVALNVHHSKESNLNVVMTEGTQTQKMNNGYAA
jgi:hypothetical protein